MSIEYKTYDELIALVANFRSEHRNLTDDELDKLIKKTFKIDQTILRELDGVSDYPSLSTPSFTGVKFRNALSIITSSSM